MNIVSVTRLRLRKRIHLPAFAYFAIRSLIQARRTPGNLSATGKLQAGLVFWTITVWNGEQAMRAFRNHGLHQKAMPKLAGWCDEATYVRWEQASAQPPAPAEAHQRLVRDGIVSQVRQPSPDHATRHFPAFKT